MTGFWAGVLGLHSGVGDKLKVARLATGLSTRRVAELLPTYGVAISHATVASYERGVTVPSMDALVAMSDLYRRPLTWFLSTRPSLTGVRYRRHRSGLKIADLAIFEATCQRLFEGYMALEEKIDGVKPAPLSHRFESDQPAEDAAAGLRVHLGLSPREPIRSAFDIVEDLGVRAIDVDCDERIDGLSARMGVREVLSVNRSKPPARLRLDAIHELFHLLFGDCDGDETGQSKSMEERAFEGASYFLLPRDVLTEAFRGKSMVRLVQYKEMYGVSLAAMVYRASKIGLINEKETRRLWIEFSKRGWRQSEPGRVVPDHPWRFEYLIDVARNTKGLRWQDISNVTGLKESELRERLSLRYGSDEARMVPGKEEDDRADFALRLAR